MFTAKRSDFDDVGVTFSVRQDEMEVLLSVMTDPELCSLKDRVLMMIEERVYEKEGFPLTCGGLRGILLSIEFTYWCRRGKGIKVEDGKMRVCEIQESPFYQRYHGREMGGDRSERPEEYDGAGVEGRVDEDKAREDGGGEGKESAIEGEEGEWV